MSNDGVKRVGTYKGLFHWLQGLEADLTCYPTGQCLAVFRDPEAGPYAQSPQVLRTEVFDLSEPLPKEWTNG